MAEKAVVKAAVVLAAGRGDRMGGPKALLLLDGMPLVELHVTRALEAGCERVVVVARPEVARRLLSMRAGLEVAHSLADDPWGSLAVGLRALAPDAGDLLFVTPVDVLPARATTFEALARAIEAGARAAIPTYHGRGGHPVALRPSVVADERDGAPRSDTHAGPPVAGPSTLRDALRRAVAARVAVDDARVVTDLDTPADVVAATGCAPLFWNGEDDSSIGS